MKKGVIIIILVLLIILAGALILFRNNFNISRNDSPSPTPQETTKDSKTDTSSEDSQITIDKVLSDVKEIVEWETDKYSRGTILWNTENEELKLEGIGYLFGEKIGSNEMKLQEKHDNIRVYLRDLGFEHDKYNVASSLFGTERSILKLNNIGCELYIRDNEIKGSTDMGLLCTDLPEKVTSVMPEPMSEKIARSIAETSECTESGALKDTAIYNESTKTWWLDLDIDKPGCNPACVVFEDESVEINWRCTGLIED